MSRTIGREKETSRTWSEFAEERFDESCSCCACEATIEVVRGRCGCRLTGVEIDHESCDTVELSRRCESDFERL